MRRIVWRFVRGALATGLVASVAGTAFGATPTLAGLQPPRTAGGVPELDSSLQKVVTSQRAGGSDAAISRAKALGVPVSGSLVRVVIVADSGQVAQAQAAVTAAGGSVEGTAGGLVQALLPPSALASVAAENGVALVRPPARPVALAVTGEEIAASNAAASTAAGFDGTGVKVAIIDLGFNGYAAKLGSELPASVTAVDDCGGTLASGTAHGTAVAEIVHEVAPGAQLYLICIDNEVDLAAAEAYAKANGIRIVNHSVAWFNAGRGDGSVGFPGSPDATVADARANGILWINAAGNEAQTHWSGTFADDGAGFNSFNGAASLDQVVIAGGQQACFDLKWDAWPTTTVDYNLGIYSLSGAPTLVASSVNDQAAGNLPPTEEACYTNPGATATFGIGIHRFSAASSPRLDLFTVNTGPLQFQTAAGSIVEPASSPNAMAVGAVCWNGFGLQPYSSQGPTIDGRTKPDISGYDAVTSSVYGASTGCDSGFGGTSAAAPNVAGIAALLLQRTPGLTPDQLQNSLETQVVDLGAAGKDNSFGAGRLALNGTLPPANTGVPTIAGTPETGSVLTAFPGTWTGTPAATFAFQWRRCDSGGASCADIGAATATTYTLVAADLGKTIRVRVTASNGVPPTASAESAATGTITAPTPAPPPPAGGGGGGGGGGSGSNDLGVTGLVTPASSPVGGSHVWRLKVKNAGGGIAFGVVLDVQLSPNMVYGFSQVTRGSGCVPVAGGLHCNLDLLGAAAGDISTAEVVIGTNVTAVGEVTLTATAAFNETDPTPTDNTLVLKANTPAPVAPPVPTPPTLKAAAVKSVFGIPLERPRAPTAGKRFTLTLPVKHGDTDKLLATALLAGRRVRHSTTFAGGTARLSLLLPKTAKGKLLKLQLTATTVGQVVNRTFTYRVH